MNILITGGSSDIAKAIATHRIAMGDNIIITASSTASLEKTLAHYHQSNLPVTGFVYNFNAPEQSEADLANLQVDALILNAFGRVKRLNKFHELSFQETQDYIATNIQGNLWLTHKLLPIMLKQGFGRLIFVSSVSAIVGTSRYSAYCTAKAALESLFLNIAVDYGADNILANIVRAGLIKTARTRIFWSRPGYEEKVGSIIPQGKMGEPFQLAEAIDPLLSASSYINGSVLTVSGGLPLACFSS